MADVVEALRQRPEPKRDRWGRYVIKNKPYTRATTWAGTVDDRHNLERWQQRQVAVGLAARTDLYARVAACRPDDKDELGKLCDQAIEAAKGSAGANLGTALHAFTERVDLGEDIAIPAPYDADVAAYTAALHTAGVAIEAQYVEQIVVNHTLGVAGTLDRLAEVPSLGMTVCDLKTGGFLSWQSIAVQLALYAYAEELYDPATDELTPMPFVNREKAVVFHLPVGQACCTLYTVDIVAGWEMAQTCGAVRRWRSRKDLADVFTEVAAPPATPTPEPGDPEVREWLIRRVARLRDTPGALERLANTWPEGVATFKQSVAHTAADLRAIAKAVSAVEFHFELPAMSMRPHADVDDRAAMTTKLKSLAPDVLEVVERAAKAAQLPPVGRMTAEQLETLGELVVRAEASAVRRGSAA